jgi:hypothetical protein
MLGGLILVLMPVLAVMLVCAIVQTLWHLLAALYHLMAMVVLALTPADLEIHLGADRPDGRPGQPVGPTRPENRRGSHASTQVGRGKRREHAQAIEAADRVNQRPVGTNRYTVELYNNDGDVKGFPSGNSVAAGWQRRRNCHQDGRGC